MRGFMNSCYTCQHHAELNGKVICVLDYQTNALLGCTEWEQMPMKSNTYGNCYSCRAYLPQSTHAPCAKPNKSHVNRGSGCFEWEAYSRNSANSFPSKEEVQKKFLEEKGFVLGVVTTKSSVKEA